MRKSDRFALVTGSSRGVGKNIALRLADVTPGVAVHYKSNGKAAEQVVQTIKEKGKLGAAFQADLTKERDALRLIKEAEEKFGKIDILVNNFGPIVVKPWEKVTSEEWDYMWQSNLKSSLYCLKAVLPGMRRRKWGRIINIGYSRVEQLVAFRNIAPYAMAKTSLLILTRSVAASEASAGITVNMVSPGPLHEGILPQDQSVLRGRWGELEDVSNAVLFLALGKADFITGTNLIVAGGWKI